ncbi:GNAT family N-acetyltransferase [Kitasatospora sp. NPDC089797]|uniref:GNAT family N-acetyltransferase n=1 Tax=Kitasatospora sp. NPDC089797 TaxID=3155298 RepID=UPI003443734C
MTTAPAPVRPAAAPPAGAPPARAVARPARAEEAGALSRVLAAAFQEDPLTRWAFPDPEHRARVLPAFFRLHLDRCLPHHGVLTARDGADATAAPLGALLFLPPGAWEDPGHHDRAADRAAERALDRAIDTARHPDCARRLAAITRRQERRHPRHRPHFYLAFVGVHPDARGTGAGRALIEALTTEVDRHGQAAYAETSSTGGARLCASAGFTRFGEAIALPGGGPRLNPVWRGPR